MGIYGTPRVLLSDGESYVYAHVRFLDELYLVDGLKVALLGRSTP